MKLVKFFMMISVSLLVSNCSLYRCLHDYGIGGGKHDDKSFIRKVLSRENFDAMTAHARSNKTCVEPNGAQLGLGPHVGQSNGEWYYTYENFIREMEKDKYFAKEGDERTKKLEIAAFFAHIHQETGLGQELGDVGCYLQEIDGWTLPPTQYRGAGPFNPTKIYYGRGPIQLSWNYNYAAFSQADGQGRKYLDDPDILVRDPSIGIRSALWYWGTEGDRPAPHDIVLKKWKVSENDVKANRTYRAWFGWTTNIINGVECKGGTALAFAQARNRAKYFRAYTKLMGVDISDIPDSDLICEDQTNYSVIGK